VPVESLLTVGDAALAACVHGLFTNARGRVARLLGRRRGRPTVAIAGGRYSHSLRLKTM
jgi:hypothetical protein